MKKFFIKKKTSLWAIKWIEFYKLLINFILFFKFKVNPTFNTLSVILIKPSKYLTNNIWFLKYYLKLFKNIKINYIEWSVLFKYLDKLKVTLLKQMITNKC